MIRQTSLERNAAVEYCLREREQAQLQLQTGKMRVYSQEGGRGRGSGWTVTQRRQQGVGGFWVN